MDVGGVLTSLLVRPRRRPRRAHRPPPQPPAYIRGKRHDTCLRPNGSSLKQQERKSSPLKCPIESNCCLQPTTARPMCRNQSRSRTTADRQTLYSSSVLAPRSARTTLCAPDRIPVPPDGSALAHPARVVRKSVTHRAFRQNIATQAL